MFSNRGADPHRRIAYAFDEENHMFLYYMDDLILPVNYLVQIALMVSIIRSSMQPVST